jgi:hypothetical protein
MKASEVAGLLVAAKFHFRRFLVVSNVSHGMLPWEADLLVMSQSGYVSEVEIKVSIADLKRDLAKRKFVKGAWDSAHEIIKARWYAMPEAVWGHHAAADAVPADAGVIVVRVPIHAWDCGVSVIREPIENPSARKLTSDEQYQLARLGVMRHWSKLARESRKKCAA